MSAITWIEIVSRWSGGIHRVDHLRPGHTLPAELPADVIAPVIVSGLGAAPIAVSDPRTRVTYTLRRVAAGRRVPMQLLRRTDWAYVGILTVVPLFLLTLIGLGSYAGFFVMKNLLGGDLPHGHGDPSFVASLLMEEASRVHFDKNDHAGDYAHGETKRGVEESDYSHAIGGDAEVDVASAGVLGALRSLDNVDVGLGDTLEGLEQHLGSLHGTLGVDERGNRGSGLHGSAGGGAGKSVSLSDGYGRAGGGTCGCMGWPGRGEGRIGGVGLSIGGQESSVVGYDKRLIQTVIGRHLSQIKYCYERELLRNPNVFSGKLVVEFTIGANGQVPNATARANTIAGHTNVEDCVLRVFKRMRFPPPKSGTSTLVRYPLIFDVAGN